MYKRVLNIDLPSKQSAFLWGARKTGKSTYLKMHFPKSIYYDLLKSDTYFSFMKHPHLLREEVLFLTKEQLSNPIIIDEIQKVPKLLDEVHWLIENTEANFILCGSSARKLRKSGVNLLGGRAWSYYCFPLVYPEIKEFDLLKALQNGTIAAHYNTPNAKKTLKAYVNDYLTQEIKEESLVRNLPAFARFLDSIAFSNGEMVNYTNISRDCGIDAKTVKEYYQILIDTLVGYYLYPYTKTPSRRQIITSAPKFYLFDVGIANTLSRKRIEVLKGSEAGKSFEHYIYLELHAYKMMNDIDADITYWRTKNDLEVDFIIGDAKIAIETKISSHIPSTELKSLSVFAEEYKPEKLYVVCQEPRARQTNYKGIDITIMNYKLFLEKLWAGDIIPAS